MSKSLLCLKQPVYTNVVKCSQSISMFHHFGETIIKCIQYVEQKSSGGISWISLLGWNKYSPQAVVKFMSGTSVLRLKQTFILYQTLWTNEKKKKITAKASLLETAVQNVPFGVKVEHLNNLHCALHVRQWKVRMENKKAEGFYKALQVFMNFMNLYYNKCTFSSESHLICSSSRLL